MKTSEKLGIIIIVLYTLWIIVSNIIMLFIRLKCIKKKECHDLSCRYKVWCSKYEEILTDEELEILLNKLNESEQSKK